MVIAAVGVVCGDIGTSARYILKEVFSGHFGIQANHGGVLGIAQSVLLECPDEVARGFALQVLAMETWHRAKAITDAIGYDSSRESLWWAAIS
ncbi:hypothetical protein J3P90_10720 [Pseudomonas sp. D3-10]